MKTKGLNIFVKSLFVALLLLCSTYSLAYEFEYNGMYYNHNNLQLTVTYGDNPYSGNIDIPEHVNYGGIVYTVTSFGLSAFYECTSLKEVTLGESVEVLKDYVFVGCENLEKITSLNLEPSTCGEYVFHYVDTQTCTLYVPKGSLSVYSTADVWKDFFNIVEIGTTGINSTIHNEEEDISFYTLGGQKINIPQKGYVYILRYSDGTTKKVLVK